MARKYNFCAGPAALPEAVLLKAQQELLDWRDAGLSIMEMSHRSKEIVSVANNQLLLLMLVFSVAPNPLARG